MGVLQWFLRVLCPFLLLALVCKIVGRLKLNFYVGTAKNTVFRTGFGPGAQNISKLKLSQANAKLFEASKFAAEVIIEK